MTHIDSLDAEMVRLRRAVSDLKHAGLLVLAAGADGAVPADGPAMIVLAAACAAATVLPRDTLDEEERLDLEAVRAYAAAWRAALCMDADPPHESCRDMEGGTMHALAVPRPSRTRMRELSNGVHRAVEMQDQRLVGRVAFRFDGNEPGDAQ